MKKIILNSESAIREAIRDGYAVYVSNERFEVKTAFGEWYVWDTENLCSMGALQNWIGHRTFYCYTF